MSNADIKNGPQRNDLNGTVNADKVRKEWVKFDEESPQNTTPLEIQNTQSIPYAAGASTSASTEPAAVLKTESVQINLERGDRHVEPNSLATLSKNVEFVNIRQGFCKYMK